MCIVCEHQLYDEHRSAEEAPFDPCPECGKFPSKEGGSCYHCSWSNEFLAAKAQIEGENAPPRSTIH